MRGKMYGAFIAVMAASISGLFSIASADSYSSTSYKIDATMSSSGGSLNSSSYNLTSSTGENAVGNGASGSYKVGMGFVTQLDKSLQLTVQPSGLVGYWPFDEGTGAIAYDSSAYQYDAAYSTGSSFATGKVGPWAWSDTTGAQYVTVPYNTQLPSGNKLTMSAWIYHTNSDTDAIMTEWQYGGGPGNGAWAFQLNPAGTQLRFFLKNGSSDPGDNYVDTTNANLSTNTWYHVAAVYDGTQAANSDRVKLYLNGVEQAKTVVGTLASTLTSNTANMVIGDFPDLNRQWNGRIDEVKLYNRALSQPEIAAEYAAGTAGYASGLSLGAITPGVSNTSLVDVITQTDGGGYNLAINQNHDMTDGTNTISPIGGSIASPLSWNEGSTKGLGFTLTATNATAIPGSWNSGNSYAAFPSTATTFYNRVGMQNGKDYLTMRLRADVPMTVLAGPGYNNTITITGTITP